jgi:hypothetical protein
VITYRATLDVPLQLMLKVSRLLKKHRAERGTRNGTRALTCWQQAKFLLAWFRDKPDLRRLGQGFGISQSTAYRYKDEGVEVLAREAPVPGGSPRKGRRAGTSLRHPGRHADLLRPLLRQETQQEGDRK